MGSALQLRPAVLAARQRLTEGRERLRARHLEGTLGVQISAAVTDLLDTIVLELFESALDDLGESGPNGLRSVVALVPHGGYGRRDMAPFSDVDLMILHSTAAQKRVIPLAERMLRDLCDAGLQVGQTARTSVQACSLAWQDATICTSLIESRYLAGSVGLYSAFARRFARQTSRRSRRLFAEMQSARSQERAQYGETVYMLEPNIKRSRGGLRDVQLLRWVGFARHGAADPDGLRLAGALAREDYEQLRRSIEYLLRLRNEMHFHAGKSNDVLDRAEQVRLATLLGFQGTPGLLPVEQFMQQHFQHTEAISDIMGRFVIASQGTSRLRTWLAPLVSHQFERDFLVGPGHISVNRSGAEKLATDLSEVLRLTDVANLYDKPLSHQTFETVRVAVQQLPDTVSRESAERFKSLLSQPARLGELLRVLHRTRALEKIIPSFAHARCLLQFNEYHKYTVDEHCLRAVEQATDFAKHKGVLGETYRSLKQKWLLHLALLLHDLGKGYEADHSDVGLQIAGEIAERLYLSQTETETLKFLVHRHLVMSHLAFRRDTSDEQLILNFAVEVGSPDVLQMLVLLTAADLAAVGPGVLNAWKIDVLADVYHRALVHLAGQAPPRYASEWLSERRQRILELIDDPDRLAWYERQVEALSSTYLRATPVAEVAGVLRSLSKLEPGEVVASGRYLADGRTVQYEVGTNEAITPGVFHKLTGALARHGLQILAAEIDTLADGLIFDRFVVEDPDYAGGPPPDRLNEVSRALVAALTSGDNAAPPFRRVWRPQRRTSPDQFHPMPTRVRVDNSTSDRFTIIDVFAADRQGLLFTIAERLFQLGLSVSFAKIGTYLDQVVDVFYVTDQSGRKIEEEGHLDHIRREILAAVESLAAETQASTL